MPFEFYATILCMTRTYTPEQRAHASAKAREYYYANHEERKAYARQYRAENIDHARALQKKSRDKLLDEIYEAYGNVCKCCGESNKLFLSIDHVNGGGTKHRKLVGGSQPIYRDIKKQGFPQDEYQLLCFNCNLGRERNDGLCPHAM
jgi:hypothetical protein